MKRKSVATLLFITAVTMTGCSLSFSKPTNAPQISDYIHVQEYEDAASQLADAIDNADLLSEEDVEQLAGQILGFADEMSESSDELGEFQKARLVRVVDGDTIVVDIDGEECKVRLIGVNTPESVASQEYLDRTGKENTQEGKDASEYVKELLGDTQYVYLEKDTSDTDKYGRLLRYVWLEVPDDKTDPLEVSEKMLNGLLVWEGVAEVATYAPDTEYQEVFEYLHDYSEMEVD